MNKKSIFEYEDKESIVEWLNNHLTSNDAVLVKGSHGLQMEQIVTALETAQ